MKKAILVAIIGALTLGVNAGDWGKAPVYDDKTPVESLDFSGEATVGYDTRYLYRGLWFGNDVAWGDVSISKELTPNLTWSANVFYIDVLSNALSYSEANLGTGLAYDSNIGTFSVGFLFYKFFDGFAGNSPGVGPGAQQDASEVNIGYSRELFAGITASALAAYDFRISAMYFEGGLSKSWVLTDTIGLELSGALGYGLNDYYSQTLSGDARDGITHGLVSLALPIAITDNATFSPHISANFSGDGRTRGNAASVGDTAVFYGASLAIGF